MTPTLERLLGKQRAWLHLILFILTLYTTTLAGVAWSGHDPFELTNFSFGLEYALLLLLFLSAHEFGHFIAARIHGVDVTLPYYIPFPGTMMGIMPNFGTFGAVIRTRQRIPSRSIIFDIGVAGPIAGFIVCIIILAIGFATLPGIEYLQAIHPGYPLMQAPPGGELTFGKTILYSLMEKVFANHSGYIPPMSEMYHYPMLCVGWFGLFVTALNLLPVGQLDGGHLMYGLFPKSIHRIIGIVTVSILAALSIPELVISLAGDSLPSAFKWLEAIAVPGGSSWIFWVIMIVFVIKFRHPAAVDESPMDLKRIVIGVLTILIFVLSFTPSPIVLE
ncbi:MAG: site-2 protease family protein [Bacteroidota bacterium]|nr:site-2 protease family protein [Bacteroidota bacterium]MDP4236770.1 site-2 protease family protein [Bacteroidota bacterium]